MKKKLGKFLSKSMIGAILGGVILFGQGTVMAGLGDEVDVLPPEGVIRVYGARYENGIYYTNQSVVTLEVMAYDDFTATEDLQMIVSTSPVTGSETSDLWENYSEYISMPLVNTQNGGRTVFYLYLKDEEGNISPGMTVDTTTRFNVTLKNADGTTFATKEAILGTPFCLPLQEPVKNNEYFVGWTLTQNGDAQWESDGVIGAGTIQSDITLYPVFTSEKPLLAEKVKIGDYVDFPVYYDNVSTNYGYCTSNYYGWRVVDVEGDSVELVSAGVPLTYYHSGSDVQKSLKRIGENLLSGDEEFPDNRLEGNNGFGVLTMGSNLYDIFYDTYCVESVSTLTLDDVKKVTGLSNIPLGTQIDNFGGLLTNGTYYWLATSDGSVLWHLTDVGNIYYSRGVTYGVRPKVTLRSDIYTSGRNLSGAWTLEELYTGK